MPVLFCLVAWMKYYKGRISSDIPRGGGSYVKEYESGSEIHNFTVERIPAEPSFPADDESDGMVDVCQGFVMCKSQIRIEELGASKRDDSIDGVTVIWLAKNPQRGGVYIVGWYKNARVYRCHQEPMPDTGHDYDGCLYNVMANAADCTLLPENNRDLLIPKAVSASSGGIGQSQVWFAKGEKNAHIVHKVMEYIKSYDTRQIKFEAMFPKQIEDAGCLYELNEDMQAKEAAMVVNAKYSMRPIRLICDNGGEKIEYIAIYFNNNDVFLLNIFEADVDPHNSHHVITLDEFKQGVSDGSSFDVYCGCEKVSADEAIAIAAANADRLHIFAEIDGDLLNHVVVHASKAYIHIIDIDAMYEAPLDCITTINHREFNNRSFKGLNFGVYTRLKS